MANLSVKSLNRSAKIPILDPGAGLGILSHCLIYELRKPAVRRSPRSGFCLTDHTGDISLDAWEIDPSIIPELTRTYKRIEDARLKYTVHRKDFITDISHDIFWKISNHYDAIIMNPPYKKMNLRRAEFCGILNCDRQDLICYARATRRHTCQIRHRVYQKPRLLMTTVYFLPL